MSTPQQQFSLKWNNYAESISSAINALRINGELTDVTLSCEGKKIKVHKLLLAACSAFFKEAFIENQCSHPIVILNGVSFQDLLCVIQFMYNGHVNVTQDRLQSFLQTAEALQIKGLTDGNDEKNESSSPPPSAPVKKRPQTFPSQVPNVADTVRHDTEARPPTPKRKRVIGSAGGTFSASAQNSELPGTASVISASGAAVAGVMGNNNNNSSHHHANNNPPPPPLISRNNSENSADGLPLVKYEDDHDMDDDYDDPADDNDNSYQDNNGKEVIGGESNSLGSITSIVRTCTSLSNTGGAPGERRPRYNMQPSSSNELVGTSGVVDATNVNGRHHNGHMSRADLVYASSTGNYAHTNGTVVATLNGNSSGGSKLRNRLNSRSLSSGAGGSNGGYQYHQQQQQQQQHRENQDRIIRYAPLQSAHNSSSSHDSRSNSSHEDARDRHYPDDGSAESLQGTDEDDEVHQYKLQQKRSINGAGLTLMQAHQQSRGRGISNLMKGSGTLNAQQTQQQQQPVNYRSATVVNGTISNSRAGIAACDDTAEDLSQSSPAALMSQSNATAPTTACEMSTPSFSLTQQILQQNELCVISKSSNSGTEGVKKEGSCIFPASNRVNTIAVQLPPGSSSNNGININGTKGDQAGLAATYECDVCGRKYVHHRSLNDHKKSHTGATKCKICNKSFSKVANMRAHFTAQHGSVSENGMMGGGGDTSSSSSNGNISPQQNSHVAMIQTV